VSGSLSSCSRTAARAVDLTMLRVTLSVGVRFAIVASFLRRLHSARSITSLDEGRGLVIVNMNGLDTGISHSTYLFVPVPPGDGGISGVSQADSSG
jgi:hypothetical protein